MSEERNIFSILRSGDVIVVDRGFRDCIDVLNRRGFVTKIPKGTTANQLSRADANKSRFATKTRFVIEVRNSHIKNKWKQLSGTKIHQSIPHLKKDFQIAAALVNAFCCSIVSDQNDWNDIGELMLHNLNQPNTLHAIVHLMPRNEFQTVNNLTLFPKLTYSELKSISQGSYQIRQAVSYCQLHAKNNNNNVTMHIWQGNACKRLCGHLLTNRTSEPLLLSADLRSRFQSNRTHRVFVLLSSDSNKYVISGFSCSCRHGFRTVGCCSHVMAVIWYTLHINHNQVRNLFPSSDLSEIFARWQNEYSTDSDSDTDSSSSSDPDDYA